jgi:hypothetical protein
MRRRTRTDSRRWRTAIVADPTDAEAIAASKHDASCFGVIFDRHATTLFRFLVRRVGPDDAEDLLGEVFSVAFDVGQATAMINVDVVNIDDHYAHAVAEGADVTMPIQDAFYGSRRYEASDLEGNRWHFSETFESIRARGGSIPSDEPGDW